MMITMVRPTQEAADTLFSSKIKLKMMNKIIKLPRNLNLLMMKLNL